MTKAFVRAIIDATLVVVCSFCLILLILAGNWYMFQQSLIDEPIYVELTNNGSVLIQGGVTGLFEGEEKPLVVHLRNETIKESAKATVKADIGLITESIGERYNFSAYSPSPWPQVLEGETKNLYGLFVTYDAERYLEENYDFKPLDPEETRFMMAMMAIRYYYEEASLTSQLEALATGKADLIPMPLSLRMAVKLYKYVI